MSSNAPDLAPAPVASSKKTIIIIIVVAVLAVVGSVLGAVMIMKRSNSAKEPAEPVEAAHAEVHKIGAFVPLESFTINLADTNRERFVSIGVTLEVSEPKVAEQIKTILPILRSKIILLISAKTGAELLSIEGKKKLSEEILEIAREVASSPTRIPTIYDVHFATFVVQ